MEREVLLYSLKAKSNKKLPYVASFVAKEKLDSPPRGKFSGDIKDHKTTRKYKVI